MPGHTYNSLYNTVIEYFIGVCIIIVVMLCFGGGCMINTAILCSVIDILQIQPYCVSVIEVPMDSGKLKQIEVSILTVCGSTDLFIPKKRFRVRISLCSI